MKILRVSKFQTSDGRLFDDEIKAKEHENMSTAVTEMVTLLTNTLATGRPEAIAKHIVYEMEAIQAILTRYRKRMPRKSIKEAA